MPVKKTILIVKGEVQGVTYRDYVKAKAINHDVNGYVENLPDGTVEIGCIGEQEKIDSFITDIKSDTGKEKLKDCFAHVIDVKMSDKPFEGEYSSFIVKVGKPEHEIREGFASAVKFLRETNDRIGDGFDKIDNGINNGFNNTNDNFKELLGETNNEISNGFNTTNDNFKNLDGKYHTISQTLYVQVVILILMLIVLLFGFGILTM